MIKKKFKKNYIDLFLISFGVLVLVFLSAWRFYNNRILSFNVTPKEVYSEKTLPVQVVVGNRFKLKVNPSGIVNGVWQIKSDSANFLVTSSRPGDVGNMVIYAHNTKNLFGPLLWVKKGELVQIINETGETFNYEIEDVVTVNADEIDYVTPKDKEMVTLYTCTGFLDSKRLIVIAYPRK